MSAGVNFAIWVRYCAVSFGGAAISEARQRFLAQSYAFTDYYVVGTERVR